jgi:hypothetical protein
MAVEDIQYFLLHFTSWQHIGPRFVLPLHFLGARVLISTTTQAGQVANCLTGKTRLLRAVLCGFIIAEGFVMPEQENNIEELESQFPALSGVAFAAPRVQALAFGNSVLQSEHGHIYEVFPDGRRVLVKNIEPPTTNIPGRKITIRWARHASECLPGRTVRAKAH